jgi:hypothetical protein
MELLTNETKAEQILSFINWDLRILDAATQKNKDEEKVGPYIHTHVNLLIENFESELSNILPEKRNRFIFSTVNKYKIKLDSIREFPSLALKERNLIDIDPENYHFYNLQSNIFVLYESGLNPLIEDFRQLINPLMEHPLMLLKYEIHSGHSKYTFNKTPLKDFSKDFILENVYNPIINVITYIEFYKYLEKRINEIEGENVYNDQTITKLLWKGTPAHFGYILDLLINKGYIDRPKCSGEAFARNLLQLFEFERHNPSAESLSKNINKYTDPIKNPNHKAKFMAIPARNELDK